jgi:hypothetical protein
MTSPIAPTLCPHKVNPTTCWFCIRDRNQRAQHEAAARMAGGATTGDPLLDMVAQSAPIAPPPPRHVVPAPRGEQAFQPKADAKAPKTMDAASAAAFATAQGRLAEQESQHHWTQDANGQAVPPPKRPEVISRLASHPDAPQK